MKRLFSLVAMLCLSLLFSCAPEIEPIPEYPSSSGTSSSNVVVLGSSSSLSSSSSNASVISSSSMVSSSSRVISSSSGSWTYCLDYDWQECTLSNGYTCPDWSTPSNSCPSGWYIYNSSSSSKPSSSSSVPPSSSSVKPSSSSVVTSSSSAVVPSSSSITLLPSSSSAIIGMGLCDGFVNGTTREHYGKEKAQFCDSRDGKKYVYVTIGEQIWMAENLNYNTNTTGSRCWGDQPANCEIHGMLYNWTTAMANSAGSATNPSGVRGVCPTGWHLPSNAEWDVLINYASDSLTAGTKLKAKSGWNTGTGYIAGTDTYGFSALPSGCFSDNHFGCNTGGYWWTTSEVSNSSIYVYFKAVNEYEDIYYRLPDGYKGFMFSVRCVKD